MSQQQCLREDSRMFQESFQNFLESFKGVSRITEGCFKGVLWVFQRKFSTYFMNVFFAGLKNVFKEVAKEFQECFKGAEKLVSKVC